MTKERDELIFELALDVFARLIELLATHGTVDRADALELIEIVKRYERGL